jgi:hypothetical protein
VCRGFWFISVLCNSYVCEVQVEVFNILVRMCNCIKHGNKFTNTHHCANMWYSKLKSSVFLKRIETKQLICMCGERSSSL